MFKRLHSFTIIELTITMLISSVVIGISYFGYLFLNQQFERNRAKSAITSEYFIFCKAIQADADRAGSIVSRSGELLFFQIPGRGEGVQYLFNNNFIVRSSEESSDTFKIVNSGYQPVYVTGNDSLAYKLILTLKPDSNAVNKIIEKQYSACQLMKWETDHE